MHLIEYPSPNYNNRPAGASITTIVLHYTGMQSAEEALDRLCDPKYEVSAHYMVDEDGTIYRLVEPKKRAWHAGISCWNGRASVNDVSIGIEMVNPGHEFGYRAFPRQQLDKVIELCSNLMQKYHIRPRNIIGHSDISPSRKLDPGELFDWKYLADSRVGVWPDIEMVRLSQEILMVQEDENEYVREVQALLANFGYHIRADGYYGWKTQDVVTAFKRHFVPEQFNHYWDRLADVRLKKLNQMVFE